MHRSERYTISRESFTFNLTDEERRALMVETSEGESEHSKPLSQTHQGEEEGPPRSAKWADTRMRILLALAIPIIITPLGPTSYFPSLPDVQREFGASDFEGTLTVSSYNVFVGLMPLVYGPASDRTGRKWLYIVSLLVLLGGSLMAAGAWNIWSLVVFRSIMGIGAAGPVIMASGAVSDMFPPEQRARALVRSAMRLLVPPYTCGQGLCMLPALVGPIIGPPIGGILASALGWRSTQWLMVVLCMPFLLLIALLVPETLDPKSMGAVDFAQMNPLKPLAMLAIPSVAFAALLRGFVFSSMYVATWAFPILLELYHDTPLWISGLLLIPFGVGTMLGSLFGGAAADFLRQKVGRGGYLVPLALGGSVVSVSLVVFGWTLQWSYYTVAVSVVAIAFIGTFTTCGRAGLLSFCIEKNRDKAAAVVSGVLAWQYLVVILEMSMCAIVLAKVPDELAGGISMSIPAALIAIALIPVLIIIRRTATTNAGEVEGLVN